MLLFTSLTLTQIRAWYNRGTGKDRKREKKSRKEKGEITDLLKIISCYRATWRGPGEMGIAD